MLNKLHHSWSAKLIIMIFIIQMLILGHLSNLQISFSAMTKNSAVHIVTPCPKAEALSKLTQQLCQSHLILALSSNLATCSFFILLSLLSALTDHYKRYKMLIYSIFKPPKTLI